MQKLFTTVIITFLLEITFLFEGVLQIYEIINYYYYIIACISQKMNYDIFRLVTFHMTDDHGAKTPLSWET